MMFDEEQDDISSMSRKDTEHNIPLGWAILFIGLIIWGIYYLYAYTPSIGGWSQNDELEQTWKENK